MEINDKLLKKLSQLAALHLKEPEKTEIKNYLKTTLSHFEKIKTIDTHNIEPLNHPLKLSLVLRADQVVEFPDKAKLLQQAPSKQGALIKVPPTV